MGASKKRGSDPEDLWKAHEVAASQWIMSSSYLKLSATSHTQNKTPRPLRPDSLASNILSLISHSPSPLATLVSFGPLAHLDLKAFAFASRPLHLPLIPPEDTSPSFTNHAPFLESLPAFSSSTCSDGPPCLHVLLDFLSSIYPTSSYYLFMVSTLVYWKF